MAEVATPVLYLDIDDTVRQGYDTLGRFVNRVEDVHVYPEAVAMMRRWKYEVGGRIAGVSNQGGIALGKVDYADVFAAMIETVNQAEGLFDRVMICRHHPDAEIPEQARCWCRKPSAGAIVEAAHGLKEHFPDEYYPPHLALMVGDRPEDFQCAQAANVDFRWAEEWRAQAWEEGL